MVWAALVPPAGAAGGAGWGGAARATPWMERRVYALSEARKRPREKGRRRKREGATNDAEGNNSRVITTVGTLTVPRAAAPGPRTVICPATTRARRWQREA